MDYEDFKKHTEEDGTENDSNAEAEDDEDTYQ